MQTNRRRVAIATHGLDNATIASTNTAHSPNTVPDSTTHRSRVSALSSRCGKRKTCRIGVFSRPAMSDTVLSSPRAKDYSCRYLPECSYPEYLSAYELHRRKEVQNHRLAVSAGHLF